MEGTLMCWGILAAMGMENQKEGKDHKHLFLVSESPLL